MVNHGGLLTEFMTLTNADEPNFVRRNRIVAGMADSVILVESAVLFQLEMKGVVKPLAGGMYHLLS